MEMRSVSAVKILFAVLVLLHGCGNSSDVITAGASFGRISGAGVSGANRDASQPESLRAALEADGKPVISVTVPSLNYTALMAHYYPGHFGAMVWSSMTYETVALRDGIVTQTRGFGRDIMASQTPGLAQIRATSGGFHRVYEYLDGDDQAIQVNYDCDFVSSGSEAVIVLGRSYQTHKVTERCSSPSFHFDNIYWIDGSGKIRQSSQLLAPGLDSMLIQSIID